MHKDVTVRDAGLADIPCLVEFNLALAMETEDLRLDPHVVARGVRAVVREPGRGAYVVGEVNGDVVGSLMVTEEWSDWRNGAFWWIQSLYVRPECRGRGVCRQLFETVRTRASQAPRVCGLRLYVERDNHVAARAYTRLHMQPSSYRLYEHTFQRKPDRD